MGGGAREMVLDGEGRFRFAEIVVEESMNLKVLQGILLLSVTLRSGFLRSGNLGDL